MAFSIIPRSDGLELTPCTKTTKADTEIEGPLTHFCRVGVTKASNTSLLKNQLKIKGDPELGEMLREILQKIDIDWEEHLSRVVGDPIALKFCQTARRVADTGKGILKALALNFQEYLHHEARLTPHEHEVEMFIRDVTTLKHDVDRLEARLNRLTNKRDET